MLISGMPAKSLPVDSIPTSFIKACPAVFFELAVHIANCSLTEDCFPNRFKQLQVTSVRKRGLHKNIPANLFQVKYVIKNNGKTGIGQAASVQLDHRSSIQLNPPIDVVTRQKWRYSGCLILRDSTRHISGVRHGGTLNPSIRLS